MLALGTVCQAPATITQTPKWLQTAHASSSRRTTRRGQRGPCASWSAGGRGGGSVLARASAVLTPEKQDAMQEHGPRGPTLSAATALPTSTLSPPPLRLSCSVFFQRQTHTSSPLQTFPGPRGEGMIFPASPLGPPDAWSSHRSDWRGPIRSESGRLPPQGGPAALLCGSPGLALCGAQSGKCLLNNVSFKYILRKGLSDNVFQPQEL